MTNTAIDFLISMTKEEKFVVNPLVRWFKRQGADWKLYKPRYGTAATGWDIEAQRKNQDLLIEAKYIDGPFLASIGGLVIAPLANRPQHLIKRKYRSWSYGVCWAIGTNYAQRNIYQLLFDYFVRNLSFWEHYTHDLRLKYVFFVQGQKVARVPFEKLLSAASRYRVKAFGRNLNVRRITAEKLMAKSLNFS